MSETAAPASGTSAEQALRAQLAAADLRMGSVAPVLRHLVSEGDNAIFADGIIARVRGMQTDLAGQLLDAVADAAGHEDRRHDEGALALLADALAAVPGVLEHLHALALEWQLIERLQARSAIDPVVSPLLEALVVSPDADTAGLAMNLLAAQARFTQAQRRMKLPLAELPADQLHGAIAALDQLGGGRSDDGARAAAAIRARYDEGRSRLGLMARVVTGLGGGAVAALSLSHAGVSIFATALALATGQDREIVMIAASERHLARLAVALRAAGLKSATIAEQCVALDPEFALPDGLESSAPIALLRSWLSSRRGRRSEMAARGPALAQAITDGKDRLISADEPLAGLHLRCGGELPGTIAVPALLECVAKARRYGLRLARAIQAQDLDETITAWVEVEPRGDGDDGCRIVLRNWQATPLPVDALVADQAPRAAIDREVAELTARLDADQNLLAVDAEAADLAETSAAMAAGVGRPWTDFVTISGSQHRQPMHWRILDGATLTVPGSARPWHATLLPLGAPGQDPAGFELYLTSPVPLPLPVPLPTPATPARAGDRLIGRDIAPVLRPPIARIIANAETIRTRLAGPLPEEYSAYAGDIANAAQHLLELVDDLADLEVVEADDFTVTSDRIDLADVARRAAGLLAVKAREAEIAIDAPQSGESTPAIAEFRRVMQVLINLIGNAIRYSPAGSQVWVRVENADGRARAIVADQGPGLSPEQQARVFEKFERLGRTDEGGTGLGLYIARRLARALGGELSVESAPGQGARFILEVPADPGGG